MDSRADARADRKRRVDRIAELFEEARQLEPKQRDEFLDDRCAGDAELKSEVESLLQHDDDPSGVLDRPAIERAMLIAPAPDEPPPARIGHFQIESKIGEGGMGEVFLAKQTQPVRREVALKILKAGADSKQVAARFDAERQALALMDHPYVAKVFDAGESEDGRLYFAMERFDGDPITDYCESHGLPIAERLRLFLKVCSAIQHAHQKGVIHRDIKPSNVLVGERDGEVVPKVIDFGIAKAMHRPLTTLTLNTYDEQVLGTPQFMSPEQARLSDQKVDTRSDIYSLGVLLYELLTGALPYSIETLAELLDCIRTEDPMPPSSARSGIDDDVETIVLKCLSKEPDRRYQSVGELAADIERFLEGKPIEAKRDSGWYVLRKHLKRHRIGIGISVSFLVLLAASSVVAWVLYADSREKLWTSHLRHAQALTQSQKIGRRFEGLKAIAEATRIRASVELRTEAIAAFSLCDLEHVRKFEGGLVSSSEGLAVVDRFARGHSDGRIEIVMIEDGTVVQTLEGPELNVRVLKFTPSGSHLAVKYHTNTNAQYWVWDLAAESPVVSIPAPQNTAAIDFGGGSRWVAVGTVDATVKIFDLPSGDPRSEFPGFTPYRLRGHPTEDKVALATFVEPYVKILDVDSGRFSPLETPKYVRGLAWSLDGTRLATGCDDTHVYVWTDRSWENGAEPQITLAGHQGNVVSMHFHPSGTRLMSQAWDRTSRFWDLDARREMFNPLEIETAHGFDDTFTSRNYTTHELSVWRFEPGGEYRELAAEERFGVQTNLAFDPTSGFVAAAADNGVAIWNPETGEQVLALNDEPSLGLAYTASGVLFTVSRTELRRWTFVPDGDRLVLEAGDTLWSGDGLRGLCLSPDDTTVFVTGNAGITAVHLRDASVVRTYPGYKGLSGSPQVSRDGKWLLTGCWFGKQARIYDVETADVVHEFPGSRINPVVSSDGAHFFNIHHDRCVLHEIGTWQAKREFSTDVRGTAAFAPDRRTAAVRRTTIEIDLVDLTTGEVIATLRNPHRKAPATVAFSHDGSYLAAVTRDRVILCWDLRRIRSQLAEVRLDW